MRQYSTVEFWRAGAAALRKKIGGIIVDMQTTLIVLLILFLIWLGLTRLARRTGASSQEINLALPGDDLITAPDMIMDRAGVFNAAAGAVWPWVTQLGKSRGGWYGPAWLERFTHGTDLSGLRRIEPAFQHLEVGDFIPEYGPGQPVFKLICSEPPHTLVYLSVRSPAANWTWPDPHKPLPADVFQFSWALILKEIDPTHCRFTIRFRAKGQPSRLTWLVFPLAGLIDYLTIVLMFAGLRERLAGK